MTTITTPTAKQSGPPLVVAQPNMEPREVLELAARAVYYPQPDYRSKWFPLPFDRPRWIQRWPYKVSVDVTALNEWFDDAQGGIEFGRYPKCGRIKLEDDEAGEIEVELSPVEYDHNDGREIFVYSVEVV